MTLTDREKFERELDDLAERAARMIDGPRSRADSQGAEECDMVERVDCVVAVMDVRGRDPSKIRVSLEGEEMRVEGPDLHIRTPLPCLVDPLGLGSEYRNGILSVKIMKPT